MKARTGSPVARLPGSLTSNELVEVQRRRITTLFASNEGLSQRPQADLTILKQPQGYLGPAADLALRIAHLHGENRARVVMSRTHMCSPGSCHDSNCLWPGGPSKVCGVVQSGGRLPGERGDRVEIFVDMQDVQPGKLGARRNDEVGDRRASLLAPVGQ